MRFDWNFVWEKKAAENITIGKESGLHHLLSL